MTHLPFRSYLFLLFCILFLNLNCLSGETNQLGTGTWEGRFLDSEEKVVISRLPHSNIALNVYSPNCVPCWKEIEVLNRIYSRLAADSRFGIYMIVDPLLVVESSEGYSSDISPMEFTKEVMRKEVRERGIKLPVILMEPPFQVSNTAFVTGTPETILVRTNPWNIYYNFIGAISEETDPKRIDKDSKVKFLISSMGAQGL